MLRIAGGLASILHVAPYKLTIIIIVIIITSDSFNINLAIYQSPNNE